MVWGMQDSK